MHSGNQIEPKHSRRFKANCLVPILWFLSGWRPAAGIARQLALVVLVDLSACKRDVDKKGPAGNLWSMANHPGYIMHGTTGIGRNRPHLGSPWGSLPVALLNNATPPRLPSPQSGICLPWSDKRFLTDVPLQPQPAKRHTHGSSLINYAHSPPPKRQRPQSNPHKP